MQTAQGFYNVGTIGAKSISHASGTEAMIALPTTVVNFSFSTELLLKALHIMVYDKKKQGHSWVKLYNSLPDYIQEDIEFYYDERLLIDDAEKIFSHYSIAFDGDISNAPDVKKLKSFLELHDNDFVKWRYLFETGEQKQTLWVSFPNLNALNHAIISVINKLIG